MIDNARWHRGRPAGAAMRGNPHLEFERLPSYSPQRNPVERFWRGLRRRAAHTRLFDTLADLKASLRARLGDVRTVRERVRTIIEGRPKRKAAR